MKRLPNGQEVDKCWKCSEYDDIYIPLGMSMVQSSTKWGCFELGRVLHGDNSKIHSSCPLPNVAEEGERN